MRALALVGSVVTVAAALLPAAQPSGATPLATARARATQINAQVQADATRLDVLDGQYQTALQKVQELQTQITQDRATIIADKSAVVFDHAALRKQALTAYMTGSSDGSLDAVFGPGGESFAAKTEYTSLAGGDLSTAVDDLGLAQIKLTSEQSSLQSDVAAAQAALSVVAAARAAARATLANEQSLLNGVNGQIAGFLAAQRAAQQSSSYAAYLARVQGSHGGPVATAPGGQGAVQAAESQIGVPYEWGGEQPGVGFDCSGLTQWSWRQVGVSIPRTAEEQMQAVTPVPLSQMEPGDLVFWGSGGSASHVGIYIGNDEVVHAPSSGQTVRIQQIWSDGLLGAGRP